MKKTNFIATVLAILGCFGAALGQDKGNEDSADRTLRGSGRVNPSSLAMEFSLPLGNYSGRGIDVPIRLSYSSKLWRADYIGHSEIPGGNFGGCHAKYKVKYAEDSASGWTSSLATPYIEYTGMNDLYLLGGEGVNNAGECESNETPPLPTYAYIRRLTVHLPSGETHELRPDDTALSYPAYSNCVDTDPNTPCYPNDPSNPGNWNLIYYAVDGSNIKYVQNSATNTYRLLMPDGSYYDFDSSTYHGADRKAVKYTDRNGNYTIFHAPDTNYPNGYWTDTLGKPISVPIGLSAPASPTTSENPQVYSLPGMTGTYKFHWKRLKGSTTAESALTDFSQNLRYYGNRYGCQSGNTSTWCINEDENTYLFGNETDIVFQEELFNPVVLAEIELPNGQKYKFTYDDYGRIERIYYPAGSEERIQYAWVPPLSQLEPGSIGILTNFGVINRKVYQNAGQGTPYEWRYGASQISNGYLVITTNPDNTVIQRFMYRGDGGGLYGYDETLAGMVYREEVYNNANPRQLVSRKLTNWTRTNLNGAHWHPRVTGEQSQVFDSSGNGVSATTLFEYEGNLSNRETPVLQKKVSQYAFEAITGGGSGNLNCDPDPEEPCLPPHPSPSPSPASSPTPFPTPLSSPIKKVESTYLIDGSNYPNMVGLVNSTTVKDGADIVVSRSETIYDDSGYSPNVGRGNPTTLRTWDSTKGAWDDPNAYIQTRAKFDQWGNQYEAIDAKGNSTVTTFDSNYHTFPVEIASSIPDPNPSQNQDGQAHGSNTAFITTTTFDPVTGLPLSNTAPNGLETRFEYDPVTLRLLKSKAFYQNTQVGGMSEIIYHDEPNNYWIKSRALIDTDKWVESITYLDGLGRAYKSEEINSRGNIFVNKEFDSDGRVLRVSNPYRLSGDDCYKNNQIVCWTTNVYDESSRIKEVILQDGAKVKTDYGISTAPGVLGVTKTITDQAGKKRTGITDALGRTIRVIEDPNGQNLNTDYVFDTVGNLRKTIQGEQSRYFAFDSLGRLLYAKQPEQETNTAFVYTDSITNNSHWSVKYEYDVNGNIIKTTDANGGYVEGVYDNLSRLKFRNYSDSTSDVKFYYDGTGLGAVPNFSKGEVTRVSSSISETRYTSFDVLGRLLTSEQRTSESNESAENATPHTFAYQYNLTALVSETYPTGRVVNYEFDEDGDLSRVAGRTANNTKTYANSFNYNSSGSIDSLKLGNGKWETAKYNLRQQVMQIGLGNGATDTRLLKIDYDYGTTTQNNGALREQKISFAGLSSEIKQTYSYDDLNRLKSATETYNNGAQQSWKQSFNYDRYGNRTYDAGNTTTLSQSLSWEAVNPTIQTSDNRLKKDQDSDNVNDYEYDKNGSVTLDAENQRFIYDAENRLKEFFKATNTTQDADATYYYDGNGHRVKKITDDEIVIFIYNAGGTLAAEYSTKLPDDAKVSYLTSDHLGSPRIITDEHGSVVSRHDYLSFGDEVTDTLGNVGGRTSHQGYGTDDEIRKQYTGYERDEESGLDYAQARYYNSKHGRFTSADPLTASVNVKNPQTFNRYSYAMNSPYKFTDPLGLASERTGSCGPRCRNSDPRNSGGGFGGLFSENGGSIQIGYAQNQQSPAQPLQPAGDGTVDSESITPTVSYTKENFSPSGNPPAEYVADFDDNLAGALTATSQKIEKLKEASLQNTEIALAQSKEFIESVDSASYEMQDMSLHECIYGRDYGGVTESGYVRIPNELGSETVNVQEGVLGRSSGGATTYNPASKAAQKANDQVGEINRIKRSDSTERTQFIKDFTGTKITLRNIKTGVTHTEVLGEKALNILFNNAIKKGESASTNRHKKKE